MIVLFTGDHIRHNYLVDSFSKTFSEITWIIEKRENYMPNIDRNYCVEINKLQKIHFEKRLEAEKKFFKSDAGDFSKNKVIQIIKINRKDISNGKLKKIISKIKIKLFITYGVGKIPKKILKDLNCYKWNIHGGLSPWYRGAITHFWPSYLLEPEFTGMTLHELTEDIDGGSIIHQNISKLNVKDGIHQNACRTVKSFFDDLPSLVKKGFRNRKKLVGINSNTHGRIWTSRMWSPIHLKLIYKVYEDKINKYCVENKTIIKPKIKSVLVGKNQ
tara:strand:- start:3611 stop:4429 length:819 start_codon:yes stop_codon:yes gene_type:complete